MTFRSYPHDDQPRPASYYSGDDWEDRSRDVNNGIGARRPLDDLLSPAPLDPRVESWHRHKDERLSGEGASYYTSATPRGAAQYNEGRNSSKGLLGSRAHHGEAWSLDDFDVGPKLGEGRFGKIYLSREKVSKYAVVLKAISKEAVLTHNLQHQIRREVELQMYCRHKHILRMLAYFWDEERIFLVLDFAEGGNLATMLDETPLRRLKVCDGARMAAELCMAVQYLHRRGIVHRDVKPENILLKRGEVQLADFTWAVYCPTLHESREPTPRRKRRNTLCGTVDYLPPEMVLQQSYDEGVDMWSVGATVFEMLVGFPPFETSTVRETQERIIRGALLFPKELLPLSSPLMERGGSPRGDEGRLTQEAVDFIRRLLQVNPSMRMTADEAVHHPFIASIVESKRTERLRRRSLSMERSHPQSQPQHLGSEVSGESDRRWDKFSATTTAAPSQTSAMHHSTAQNDDSRRLHFSAVTVSANSTAITVGGAAAVTALQSSVSQTATSGHDVTASTAEGHDDVAEPVVKKTQIANNTEGKEAVERMLSFDPDDNHKGAGSAHTPLQQQSSRNLAEVSTYREGEGVASRNGPPTCSTPCGGGADSLMLSSLMQEDVTAAEDGDGDATARGALRAVLGNSSSADTPSHLSSLNTTKPSDGIRPLGPKNDTLIIGQVQGAAPSNEVEDSIIDGVDDISRIHSMHDSFAL